VLVANPQLANTAQTEDDLRQAVALPGCPWNYLRFIKSADSSWAPAAGIFAGWPKTAAALKCLDPCMGSGHFVVAMFERLVALRLAEQQLTETAAVTAVIEDNLFGLELDQRCTQISAFNLALTAWRKVGHCKLPAMNLACSGLAPNTSEADWLVFASDSERLRNGMGRLHRMFQQAAVLGSLINQHSDKSSLLVASFPELQSLLEKALEKEADSDKDLEAAVTARGLAKAAEILAGKFTLVATNVPYLGRGKQHEMLALFCKRVYPDSKADLAACFVERCLLFCEEGGTSALVTPQSWHFQGRYSDFRKRVLMSTEWNFVAQLGAHSFETINGEQVSVSLSSISALMPTGDTYVVGLNLSDDASPIAKAVGLKNHNVILALQSSLSANPDSRIVFEDMGKDVLLQVYAYSWQGIKTSDDERFAHFFWEFPEEIEGWNFYQRASRDSVLYSGRQEMIFWENGFGHLTDICQKGASFRGKSAWGKIGVAICMMGNMPATLYTGEKFSADVTIIEPKDNANLLPIWSFCSSPEYVEKVSKIDRGLKATNTSFGKIPFELAHWQKVAAEIYPDGLPKPFSSDAAQWLFNGHPAGADQPIHVAMARLVGYLWPRQTGSSFPDCPALGPDGLEALADDDGIVCLASVRGEASAAERLRKLLASALGDEWSTAKERELLLAMALDNNTIKPEPDLESWLRNSFFSEHCKLFHSRPFIWQIWDGNPHGFSALVNYHKLAAPNGQGRKTLDQLTFTYLGDWIDRQKDEQTAGINGADDRLAAALDLQGQLKKILAGEPPYDIFVRWKPLHQQAIGWEPDINDGVRLNIRPFLVAQLRKGGKTGAGILRAKPGTIKWARDRGKEPLRAKDEFPWFWGWDENDLGMNPSDPTRCANFGAPTDIMVDEGHKPRYEPVPAGDTYDGNRWNDLHYSRAAKEAARVRQEGKQT
jgi:hypothetical protein